ncbi:MAG: hypothetical protein Q9174_004660, partial [Haloplaca sp. 1 TL-2023]
MASFDGKVIAITGAASGIGLATAHLLASRGASVSLADVQEEGLTKASASIQQATPKAKIHTKVVNVASAKEVETWITETTSHFGRLDGAANLAGIAGKETSTNHGALENVSEEDFDEVLSVNVKGVFNCMKFEIRGMKGMGGKGGIVNASSVAGLRGYPNHIAYCTSKHAVIGMSKTAAKETGKAGIRVNAIAP